MPLHDLLGARAVRVALILLACALGAGCASATAGQGFGWVLAEQPNAVAQYTPRLDRQWNSKAGTNTVARVGTGVYVVTFDQLGNIHGGSLQVTAFGSGAAYCHADAWVPAQVSAVARVVCFDGATPTDSAFVAAYTATNPADTAEAYGLYKPPATPPGEAEDFSVPADPAYSAGITRFYHTLKQALPVPVLTSHSFVQLTAVGSDAGHCNFSYYGANCFDATGAATDRAFSYANGLGRVPIASGQPSPSSLVGQSAWFELSGTSRHTWIGGGGSWGGQITSSSLGVGQYLMTIPGASVPVNGRSLALVTAYVGPIQAVPAVQCKIVDWTAASGPTRVEIRIDCYSTAAASVGTHMDSGVRVTFLTTR